MSNNLAMKVITTILLFSAISFTGCETGPKGIDSGGGRSDQSDNIETVDVTGHDEGSTSQDSLTPEEQRRIEEEELARKEKMESLEAMELGKISLTKDLFFDYDRSDLSATARDILAAIAEWMGKDGSVNLRLEGHADARGTSEYNLALGDKRANAAQKYLVTLGVGKKQTFHCQLWRRVSTARWQR